MAAHSAASAERWQAMAYGARTSHRTDRHTDGQTDRQHMLAVSVPLLDHPHGTRCRHRYATVNYHPRSGMN